MLRLNSLPDVRDDFMRRTGLVDQELCIIADTCNH